MESNFLFICNFEGAIDSLEAALSNIDEGAGDKLFLAEQLTAVNGALSMLRGAKDEVKFKQIIEEYKINTKE